MAKEKLDTKLDAAMRDSLKAYSAGDRRFFDFLRNDVRVYTLQSSSPIVGRKEFEAYYAPTFVKQKRKVAVVHSDIRPAETQAVLSQTLQITASGISSHVRQTVIWDKTADGKWQMSHIHNALVGQPVITGAKIPTTANAVRVLNERIATVAATVGVAQ